MIYFFLAMLGQDPTRLTIAGARSVIQFGTVSDHVTLVRNATKDELVCSGKIKATDLLIEGTSTTVSELITRVAALETQMASLTSSKVFGSMFLDQDKIDIYSTAWSDITGGTWASYGATTPTTLFSSLSPTSVAKFPRPGSFLVDVSVQVTFNPTSQDAYMLASTKVPGATDWDEVKSDQFTGGDATIRLHKLTLKSSFILEVVTADTELQIKVKGGSSIVRIDGHVPGNSLQQRPTMISIHNVD